MDLPLIFVLAGLVLYTVLAGADFGAGLWQLTAGSGPGAERLRDHAHRAIAPVWEANHVWLIFAITVMWTAYPVAFGSIASTLTLPLFIAAVGIIMRGVAYAMDAGATDPAERRTIDSVFALSSVLTPFALGTVVGGIASRRVPVGNAAGSPFSSWLNPTSVFLGILAVAAAAFLSATYLAADAARLADYDLERRFRLRAVGAGTVTGAVALAGLTVVHADAPPLYQGLVHGPGLIGLICSALAAFTTLALVLLLRYGPARYTAALAVAAIILGWALAQHPVLLPGLTVAAAAASRDTLIAVVVAVLAGAILLFPALGLLFRLYLSGRFDPVPSVARPAPVAPPRTRPHHSRLLGRVAAACLVAGFGLLTVSGGAAAHAVGVACLLGAIASGFLAATPALIANQPSGPP